MFSDILMQSSEAQINHLASASTFPFGRIDEPRIQASDLPLPPFLGTMEEGSSGKEALLDFETESDFSMMRTRFMKNSEKSMYTTFSISFFIEVLNREVVSLWSPYFTNQTHPRYFQERQPILVST